MNRKKLALLLLVSFMATGSVIYQLRNRRPAVAVVTPLPDGIPAAAAEQPAATPGAVPVEPPTDTSSGRVRIPGSGWGRNPFLTIQEIEEANRPIQPSQTVELPAAPIEPRTGFPAYAVTAILYGLQGNRAIVDSRVVQSGDTIGQETVKEIKTGIVVLEYEGKTRELPLRGLEEAARRSAPKGDKR